MAKKLDLDLDESDLKLTVNKDYAKNYESWRQKEEVQKFKNKYGTDNVDELEEDDSDSVSSVEAEEWTAEEEKDFLRTLGALKSNDPKIYETDVKFFHEKEPESLEPVKKKAKKDKAMTLRDHERRMVLDKGGQLSDDDEDPHQNDPSYNERQNQLKRELKNALNEHLDDDSDSDVLLKSRIKTVAEQEAEEEDYVQWLKGIKQDAKGIDKDLVNLKKHWNKPELDESDKFLRDYLLNKQFETDADPTAIGEEFCPSYEEIVQQDEDEYKRDEFEVKYNFRYEEPDQEFIKQYPRTVAESIRKPNNRRKEARERRKQRKDEEKREREEEIRQIKAIQKAEAEKKLKKLRQMAADEDDIPFDVDDLQKDFDPDEHDRMMKRFENEEQSESKPTTSKEGKKKSTLEFRYRKVEPCDYGLDTSEILNTDDRKLNAWVSIKKITAYKPSSEDRKEQQIYQKKAKNVEKKKKLFASIPPEPVKSIDVNSDNKKKKRNKKRKSNMDLNAQRLRFYGVNTQKLKSTLFKKKKESLL